MLVRCRVGNNNPSAACILRHFFGKQYRYGRLLRLVARGVVGTHGEPGVLYRAPFGEPGDRVDRTGADDVASWRRRRYGCRDLEHAFYRHAGLPSPGTDDVSRTATSS